MSKSVKIIFGIFASLIVLTGSIAGGFITRHALAQSALFPGFNDNPHPDISFVLPPTTAPPTSEQTSTTPDELQTLFTPFWEAWNLIHDQYVIQPVNDVKLLEGAINGMLNTLDTGRNYYLNPDQMEHRMPY